MIEREEAQHILDKIAGKEELYPMRKYLNTWNGLAIQVRTKNGYVVIHYDTKQTPQKTKVYSADNHGVVTSWIPIESKHGDQTKSLCKKYEYAPKKKQSVNKNITSKKVSKTKSASKK